MRPIKFQAWVPELKKMFEVVSFDCARTPPYYFMPLLGITKDGTPRAGNIINRTEAPGFILRQFTGLKDKGGKEVYEGNILEYVGSNCEYCGAHAKYDGHGLYLIEWSSDDCAFECNEIGDRDNYIHSVAWDDCMVIIGNIHENPELLRWKEK